MKLAIALLGAITSVTAVDLALDLSGMAAGFEYVNALGEKTEPWRAHWGGPAVKKSDAAKARTFGKSGTLSKRQAVGAILV
jgi:hypothetical protein